MLDNMSTSDWLLLIITTVIFLYWYGTKTYNRFVEICAPYRKPIPFLGNMAQLMFQKISFADFVQETYDKLNGYKYGGIFQFEHPVFFIRDPELVKMITVKDFEHFSDHRPFATEDVEPIFGKAMINLEGLRWRNMRATLSPAFTSRKMKGMFYLMDECGTQVAKYLKQCTIKGQNTPSLDCKIEKEGDILIVEMKDLFTRYTNDVIATAAFGVSTDSLQNSKNEFYEMGKLATNSSGIQAFKSFLFFLCPSILKMFRITLLPQYVSNFYRHLVHDTMAIREREGILRPDMIHLLMQAKKGTLQDETNPTRIAKKPKQDLEDDDLTAQAVLFLLAGFDTSSSLLSFMSYLLAMHPEVQTKLQDEIDDVHKQNYGKVTYEVLHCMKYLDMVVSECLRMYPPIPVTNRICTKTYTPHSEPPVQINHGDGVWIPIYAIQHDPEYFPEPNKFDPERFSEENKNNIKPFTFLPFGNGPRNCIGNRFALMESKLVIVHLLKHFNFKAISRTPVPITLCKGGFNMSIEGGCWLGLQLRCP